MRNLLPEVSPNTDFGPSDGDLRVVVQFIFQKSFHNKRQVCLSRVAEIHVL